MNTINLKQVFAIFVATVISFVLISTQAMAQSSSYTKDENGNVIFISPDGSQSITKDNLISPNHGVVLFGYQGTYTDVIDASVLPRASGNNRAIASSETRIGKYYSTLSQGEIINSNFDIGQVHVGEVASGSEYWAHSHLAKINQLRHKHGVAPVSLNVSISNFALHKAQDMVNNQYFAHRNPNGDNIITQYMAFNPEDEAVNAVGENIALAYASTPTSIEAQVFDDLLHSPGHYQNMIDPAWDSVGLGFYYDPSQSNKVNFVQFFYTTNYGIKNGGLSEAALDAYYWNYEFYQRMKHPEAFNATQVVADTPTEETEDVTSELETLKAEETSLLASYEEKVQAEEAAQEEVESTRVAQSEASEALAQNQIEIDTIVAGNDGIIEPYEYAEKVIMNNQQSLNNTTDATERARLEAEIAEAEATIAELQPQMDVINSQLQPFIDNHIELERQVTDRAEEKRIAEETLMEKSEETRALTERLTQVQNEIAELENNGTDVVAEEVAEPISEEQVEESIEEPANEQGSTTSDYNVSLQNNIVELDQYTAPPAVEDVSESEVESSEVADESDEEELTPADSEDEIDEVSNADDESESEDENENESETDTAVESTEDNNNSETEEASTEVTQPETAEQAENEENVIQGTLRSLPQTGIADNNVVYIIAGFLIILGVVALGFSLVRRKR